MFIQGSTQMERWNPDGNKPSRIHWREELKLVYVFVEIIGQPKLWGMCLVKSLVFIMIIMKMITTFFIPNISWLKFLANIAQNAFCKDLYDCIK